MEQFTGKRYFLVPSEETCTSEYPVTPTSYLSDSFRLPAMEIFVIPSIVRTLETYIHRAICPAVNPGSPASATIFFNSSGVFPSNLVFMSVSRDFNFRKFKKISIIFFIFVILHRQRILESFLI